MNEQPAYRIKRRQRISNSVFYSFMAVLVVGLSINFYRSFQTNLELRKTHEALLASFRSYQLNNAELDSLMLMLQRNDPQTVEWVARYQWHLARPGERVFQLVPEESSNPSSSK